jgi:hypothetical protein
VARGRLRLMARGAFFEVAGAVGFVGTEALASPTALNGLGRSPTPSCSLRALLPRLDTQPWPRTRDASPAGPSKTRFPKPTTGQPSDVLFWRDLPTSSLCRTQQQSGAGPTARKLSMARLRAQEGARSSRRRAASEAGRRVAILSAPRRAHSRSEREPRPWSVGSHPPRTLRRRQWLT